MNIFYLSDCPVEAARSQCDKHVVKMILESAQMLCTAHHACSTEAQRPEKFYKQAHLNHPSTIWVRTTTANYEWMCIHALALCEEYTHRYGKIHASQAIIEWCADNIPEIPDDIMTKMPQCMPEHLKIPGNPIAAYKNYYIQDKVRFATWKNRSIPEWFQQKDIGI